MKILILIFIVGSVFAAQFEQGFIEASTIEAHQIYKQVKSLINQDVQFRSKFDQVPKIVLSIAGYHSNVNTLDFFSRVTQVTDSGFQLQVISDAKIESAKFNYLATDHSEIQTICNNIEVTKDQIDIKFQQPYSSTPSVAAFITGIHRKSDENILLEVKSAESSVAHILTLAQAESSIGICLLVGPENVFTQKELPIMQISQGLPNNIYFGISSISGTSQQVHMDVSQQNVENSFELGLTVVEINQAEIQQEENQAVSFEELMTRLNPEDVKINSLQIKSSDQQEETIAINSISFEVSQQQNIYVENQTEEDNLMTISESWLQHDLNVLPDNEQQQLLTNLIKPADFNTDSLDTQPQTINIMDSTDIVISQNQYTSDQQIDEISNDINLQGDDLEDQIENLINEQMEEAEQQNVVEDLQEKVENIENQMETIGQSKSEQFDALKIIEEQQFIVNQQKQIVEQQQLIIQQYQQMLEDQKKILLSESVKPINNQQEEIVQVPKNQEVVQDKQSNEEIIENQKIEQQVEITEADPVPLIEENTVPQINQGIQQLDTETELERDLESFNKLQKRKDQVDEKQVSTLLKDISKEFINNDEIETRMKKLEDGLTNVVNKRSNDAKLDLQQDSEVELISLEEISETIFPQTYEMEQAYFDWSQNTHKIQDGDLQKQIDEFLEFEKKESVDPLFDDFHSFFSVNQQVRNNLRKRKVLNV